MSYCPYTSQSWLPFFKMTSSLFFPFIEYKGPGVEYHYILTYEYLHILCHRGVTFYLTTGDNEEIIKSSFPYLWAQYRGEKTASGTIFICVCISTLLFIILRSCISIFTTYNFSFFFKMDVIIPISYSDKKSMLSAFKDIKLGLCKQFLLLPFSLIEGAENKMAYSQNIKK